MDKSKAIIILLVINLLAVFYMGYTNKGANRDHASRTEAELRELKQQVQMLEGQIISGVRSELIAQADKVEQLDYSITGADLAQKKANIGIQLALKEVSSSAVIAVSVTSDGQSQPTEQVLEHQGGMQYGAELELSLEQNYELTVWEKSGAGQKRLNVETLWLPLMDDVYRNRVANASMGTGISDERLNADYSFVLRDLGIPGTELERALLRIRQDGEVYDEIDVTQQTTPRPGQYGEIEDHYKIAIASGQIDNSVTLEQFARDSGYEPEQYVPVDQAGEQSGDAQYSLVHTIEFASDYPELQLDSDSAGRLSFEWVLRFKDGDEHVN